MKKNIIITCEHGGNEVPPQYTLLFKDAEATLKSHRGWDPGALAMATTLSKRLGVPLHTQTVTRLLIEMNRSLDSDQLYSEFTTSLSAGERASLKEHYYFPYRRPVEHLITHASVPVLHLSVHSFTPSFNGVVRDVDIGLLFDPSRESERIFCDKLLEKLKSKLPAYRIAFNKPYQGTDDGFTTYLRTQFPDSRYSGVEIEVNQQYVDTPVWNLFSEVFSEAVVEIIR